MIKRIFSSFLAGLLAVAPLDYLAAQTATLPISQLPTAVLPLAGTEVVPLVQNGITRKTPASNFGIFSADNLNNFPGATADQKLVAAIVAGKTHVQLSASVSFFNTLPIDLPTNFFLDCNGFTIFKLANNSSIFTMGESATISNCQFNGEGNLGYTGEIIHIVAHNNQALYNVRIVNSLGANLEIDSDTGINFTWVGGSFNRTDFTLPAVLMPLADHGTSGLRRFTDLQGNGSWFMDTRGSNLTIIEGVGMNCLTIGATTNYLLMHNSRPACAPTILGTNGQYKGVIFDAGVTIGSGAQYNIIEQQLGLTITDSSGNATNMIVPMTGNTYTQYMSGDGLVGWRLFAANNLRLQIGSIITSDIPYLRTGNSLPLNIGINSTDYWQYAADGGYYALGATGGSQGPGTINAHTKISVDGVSLSGTVTSVTCGTGLTGGTFTTTGTCALDVAHANSWTALQSHAAGDFAMAGTAHGVVVSENASAAVTTAAGTNGQILTGQTGADPLWETMTGDCTFTSAGVLGCTKQNGVSFPASFTSGGIPYASSTSAISSSALLAAGSLVTGGGAGLAPATITLGGDCTFATPNITCGKVNGVTHPSSGTSGGILGFTASGTLASSVALTQHALTIGGGAGATPTPLASLGTSTTVLHGAAAGDPTFGAVALATDVSGTLPSANGGTGVTTIPPFIAITATGVNFNSANTDTSMTITLPAGATTYQVNNVLLSGASASLSTATAGLFTAAGGGGTAIVTTNGITVTTGTAGTNNNSMQFAVNNQVTEAYTNGTLFFRVSTAQGSAATGTVTLILKILF